VLLLGYPPKDATRRTLRSYAVHYRHLLIPPKRGRPGAAVMSARQRAVGAVISVVLAFSSSQQYAANAFEATLEHSDVDRGHEGYPTPDAIEHAMAVRHSVMRLPSTTCTENCFALLMILTHGSQWDKRMAWRFTVAQHLPYGMDILHVATHSENISNETLAWLRYEQRLFSDMMITLPAIGSHTDRLLEAAKNLVNQSIEGRYKWIVKVDDDTLIQPYALKVWLESVPDDRLIACRPNGPQYKWCGGPFFAMRRALVQALVANATTEEFHSTKSGADDVMISDFTKRLVGESTFCWAFAEFLHEPQNKATHWSKPVTHVTFGVHLLKQPKVFTTAFVRMLPMFTAWAECEANQFSSPHCKAWKDAIVSNPCEALARR
jgi:hypothetical protein